KGKYGEEQCLKLSVGRTETGVQQKQENREPAGVEVELRPGRGTEQGEKRELFARVEQAEHDTEPEQREPGDDAGGAQRERELPVPDPQGPGGGEQAGAEQEAAAGGMGQRCSHAARVSVSRMS